MSIRIQFALPMVLFFAPVGTLAAEAVLPALIERYQLDHEALEKFYAPGSSTARHDRLEAHNDKWRAQLQSLDFAGLSRDDKVDYLLLLGHLDHDSKSRAATRARLAEVWALVPELQALFALEENRRAMEELDVRAAADLLHQAIASQGLIRDRLQAGQELKSADDSEAKETEEPKEPTPEAPPLAMDAVNAMRGARLLQELKGALKDWHTYYQGYRPDFGWWITRPYEELVKELDETRKLLRETIAQVKGKDDDPLIGDPIGRQALLDDLTHEVIPYTPEELIAIGERELAWCEVEMGKVAAELELADWQAVLKHVKKLHATPGGQPDVVEAQSKEAIKFVEERKLVTIDPLCKETWRLEMISAAGQRTLPFAAYSNQRMLVASPTACMDHQTKLSSMRGNNIHFTRLVTPHELIPGHHLQGYMAARHRPYRQMFRTPFLVEGWALYWEMRLWELGWHRSPEDRAGMLFWRAHRCARILVSLRFHLGQMTAQEMIELLVDRVGHERAGATSEVRRYVGSNYSPLYQCAYMTGGLQMRELHRELVEEGPLSEVQFHDAVLRQGSIPIERMRMAFVGSPTTPDLSARWRFAK